MPSLSTTSLILAGLHCVAVVLGAPTKVTTKFQIQWGNCTSSDPPGYECGQLKVPVDWSKPNGGHITLGMNRVKATDRSKRIGSLMYNPGGPGAPATPMCAAQSAGIAFFTPAVSEHFDIICPDPRGVGTSTPIKCDPDIWNKRISLFPSDTATFEDMVANNKALGESCLNLTGAFLAHVDTTSVAQDLEAIRLALDDGKLNWLGQSYGTQLGGAYAELYPENIRAMVLDGNVDHSESETNLLASETMTIEDELDRFFEWCQSNNDNDTCAFKGSKPVAELFDDLVSQANKTPIPAPGCLASANTKSAGTCQPNVTGADITFNVQSSGLLITKAPVAHLESAGWAGLGVALNETSAGNATLLSSSIATTGTSPVFPGLAIGCVDWYHNTTSFAANKYKQELGLFLAPHTHGATQSYTYQTNCIGWPVPVANPPHILNQTAMAKAPPILLVNSNHDPETSYVWAQGLLSQIPSGVLLTRNGDGHTSYELEGQASAAIDAYLVNGTLPAPNTVVGS